MKDENRFALCLGDCELESPIVERFMLLDMTSNEPHVFRIIHIRYKHKKHNTAFKLIEK